MAIIQRVTLLVALLASTACAQKQVSGAAQASASMPAHSCPVMVEGTQVSAVDTQGGAGILFTTTGDVADLRQRVQRMAAMHEQMDHSSMDHRQMGHDDMMMPEADVEVRSVEGGALLQLTPRDPMQLANLRQHVRTHATQMANGSCPMMTMGHRIPSGT